jgi:DNA-binding LacI/PurR family transcriptional regulator
MRALYLAADGGNSKTDVLLGDSTGAVLAFVRGGTSSPHNIGLTGTIDVLGSLIRAAHEAAGLPVDESLIIGTARFNRVDGATAMAALLERADPPDAVFCYSDLVASGAIHTILGRGLRVPEDVAIIGYDDIEDGRYSQPTISTISPDKRGIAQLAVDRLVLRITAAEPVPGVELRAPHRLIARQSTLGGPLTPQ